MSVIMIQCISLAYGVQVNQTTQHFTTEPIHLTVT